MKIEYRSLKKFQHVYTDVINIKTRIDIRYELNAFHWLYFTLFLDISYYWSFVM